MLGFLAKIKEISETLFKIIYDSLIHVFKAKAKFENRLIWQNEIKCDTQQRVSFIAKNVSTYLA